VRWRVSEKRKTTETKDAENKKVGVKFLRQYQKILSTAIGSSLL
jgi:hypothetical protein